MNRLSDIEKRFEDFLVFLRMYKLSIYPKTLGMDIRYLLDLAKRQAEAIEVMEKALDLVKTRINPLVVDYSNFEVSNHCRRLQLECERALSAAGKILGDEK